MKAITLREPWASLMAAGFKVNETRSWDFPEAIRNKPVAIHAAKRWTSVAADSQLAISKTEPFRFYLEQCSGWGDMCRPSFRPATLGKVLAVVRFVANGHTAYSVSGNLLWNSIFGKMSRDRAPAKKPEFSFGDYSENRSVWLSEMIFPLAEPFEVIGGQRIWNLPQDAVDAIERQRVAKDWILIENEGKRKHVDRGQFIRQSVKMLREFGYESLDVETVEDAVAWLERNEGGGFENAIRAMLRTHVVFPQGKGP